MISVFEPKTTDDVDRLAESLAETVRACRSAAVSEAVLTFVGEAGDNAIRYGRKAVRITLEMEPGLTRVRVEDRGPGVRARMGGASDAQAVQASAAALATSHGEGGMGMSQILEAAGAVAPARVVVESGDARVSWPFPGAMQVATVTSPIAGTRITLETTAL
ncbi:MAG: ATP-binding protein [Candidatus Limnocylindrales bacterium]